MCLSWNKTNLCMNFTQNHSYVNYCIQFNSTINACMVMWTIYSSVLRFGPDLVHGDWYALCLDHANQLSNKLNFDSVTSEYRLTVFSHLIWGISAGRSWVCWYCTLWFLSTGPGSSWSCRNAPHSWIVPGARQNPRREW